MVKEAFLSALLAASPNPNSAEIILVEVRQPHFDGHTIVRVESAESLRAQARPAIVKGTLLAD